MRISGINNSQYVNSNPVIKVARFDSDETTLKRIAENSTDRNVLYALALNKNLTDEIVQVLFNRNIDRLNKRLSDLGYKQDKGVFGLGIF